jgi:hypothetical protein
MAQEKGCIPMEEKVRIGRGREIVETSRQQWEQGLAGRLPMVKARLGFMSKAHHLVRNLVVRDLPYAGKPLSPVYISERLHLPVARINSILEELERNLTFLFRNPQGAVVWAFPVTVDPTPHKIKFHTGEQIYAA